LGLRFNSISTLRRTNAAVQDNELQKTASESGHSLNRNHPALNRKKFNR